MYVIRVSPNGSCLYISLRLGLEVSKLLKVNEPGVGLVDGHHVKVLESAERLRSMISDWYLNGLSKQLPGFDDNGESKPGQEGSKSIPWTRADIVAMESSNLVSGDIPDPGPERLKLVLRYLSHVRKPRTWGGVPEYTAFSYMSKLNVEIYRDGQSRIYQKIQQQVSLGTVRLLFSGSCHYDLLLSDEDAEKIKLLLPKTKLEKIIL